MRNFVKSIVLATMVGGMALGAGCGKKAATCENAVDHAVKLMMGSDEMKKASPEEKKMAEAMIAGFKGEMVKECKEKKWDAKKLSCVMDAKDMEAAEKCDLK
jgi:small lipoprotein (TIGR04454 family)